MDRDYTGGLFWDILLLSQFNEYWTNFYYSYLQILPCKRCRDETTKYHLLNPVPTLKCQEEKDKYIWELRLRQGGEPWRNKVLKNNYTLETWKEQFKNKPFTNLYN